MYVGSDVHALSYTASMGMCQVALFPGSCAQMISLCKVTESAQLETPESKCLNPHVTRLFQEEVQHE